MFSLAKPGTHKFSFPGLSANFRELPVPAFPALELQEGVVMPGHTFMWTLGASDSGPHDRMASTSLLSLFPNLIFKFFKVIK